MKRIFLALFFILFFVAPGAYADEYGCTLLTGGGAGALDALDITGASTPNVDNLSDGDNAKVVMEGATDIYYFYVFDATGTAAESSPQVIRPDDYATGGNWLLADIQIGTLKATTIELGHLTDTTLARSGAGTVTIEGVEIIKAGDNATTATTATTANAGDSATSFFSSGTIEEARIHADLARVSALPTAASLSVDDLITLSGVSEGATHLGIFSGTTITDNQTLKAAIQILETAVEAAGGGGTVDISGTPVVGDIAVFTDANTVQGQTQAEAGLDIGSDIQAYSAVLADLVNGELDLPVLTSEPTEVVNSLYVADGSGWDPNSHGAQNLVLCTAENTYVNLLDMTTGAWLFSSINAGGGELEIPNGNNPTTDTEGQIAHDTDDAAIEIYSTRFSASVLTAPEEITLPPITIYEPDEVATIDDEVPIYFFPAETYPHGVTIRSIQIWSSATCTDPLNFEEWSNNGTAWTVDSTVEAITLSGIYTQDDGTLADAAIDADDGLFCDLDATMDDIAWITIQATITINPGD
jgi:hypothetical protein